MFPTKPPGNPSLNQYDSSSSNSTTIVPESRITRLLAAPHPVMPPGLACDDGKESELVRLWTSDTLDLNSLNILEAAKLYCFCIRHQLEDPMSILALHWRRPGPDVDSVTLFKRTIDVAGVDWLMRWTALHGRPLQLDFSRAILGRALNDAKGFQALACGLKISKNIVRLDIVDCSIPPSAFGALSSALKENKSLHTLNLSHCLLDAQDLKSLGAALQVNTTLSTLDLTNTEMDDDRLVALSAFLDAASGLRCLRLSANRFQAKGVQALCTALLKHANLRTLALDENKIGIAGARVMADFIKANCVLEHINLSDCQIGATGSTLIAAAVAQNSQIKGIQLNGNTLASEAAGHLLKALTSPDTKLSTLSLAEAQLDGEGLTLILEALARNDTLVYLDLNDTGLDDAGLQRLATALSTHRRLEVIRIDSNPYGEKGMAALADAMESNFLVRSIRVSRPGDCPESSARISKYLQRNQTLSPLLGRSEAAIHLLNRHGAAPLPEDQINFVASTVVSHMAIHHGTYQPGLEVLAHGIIGARDLN
jgi:Ran GTPase-activating protein (RanGAP) involved in mRNA processing and transport